jgi:hypothetical protein
LALLILRPDVPHSAQTALGRIIPENA